MHCVLPLLTALFFFFLDAKTEHASQKNKPFGNLQEQQLNMSRSL